MTLNLSAIQQQPRETIVPEIIPDLYNKILSEFQFTVSEQLEIPEEGRIANHLHVKTREKGDVLIRFYPEYYEQVKNESGFVSFEVECLDFLHRKGVAVPPPIPFRDGSLWKTIDGLHVFAYSFLSGKCFEQSQLSEDVAKRCGEFLREFIAVGSEMTPPLDAPEGDIDHIIKGYHNLLRSHPQLRDYAPLSKMFQFVSLEPHNSSLSHIPKGIVHADFFFENLIEEGGSGKLSLIDFGDAYYGCVAMDIVIGSMEFSVKENDEWDLQLFSSFLKPNTEFLSNNKIAFELFLNLLKINCLRFAVYTLPWTIEEAGPLDENPYMKRFQLLCHDEFTKKLGACYEQCCCIKQD